MPIIEVYTQPWCPYCAQALGLLQKKGVSVVEINAPQGSAERVEATRRAGGRTSVPQIFVDGVHLGGCDDLMALDRSKTLDGILAGSSAA